MRAALAARGYRPRHALQAAAIGRVATALFLRTYERGERVHLAMLARGYAGAMPRLDALAFAPRRRAVPRRPRAALLPLRVLIRGDAHELRDPRRATCASATPTASPGSTGVDLSRRATASASPCSARTAPARRR